MVAAHQNGPWAVGNLSLCEKDGGKNPSSKFFSPLASDSKIGSTNSRVHANRYGNTHRFTCTIDGAFTSGVVSQGEVRRS